MRRAIVAAALALPLALPAGASAARFAVGLELGASPRRVAERVEAVTGGRASSLAPIRALVVAAPDARGVARLPGVAYVERLTARRLAFTPNDPMLARQTYLAQIRAFDAWPQLPFLTSVRVAVIDSGIDGRHPEFQDRIADAKSFVDGNPRIDTLGHGTMVAGLIAAATGNGQGIAGIAFPAQLLVAKVIRADRIVSVEAEVRAIRWAVRQGADVINLSLSGIRDPLNAGRDTYSPLEASAIAYAHSQGVVVVAAVGNSEDAPAVPWNYAGYPAALPHVVGVSAIAPDGSVPSFSSRDRIYNDIAAPGRDILSTLPRRMTLSARPDCPEQGYSSCGPFEFRRARGTSYAAPQVAAAAALVRAARPGLTPEQVTTILERTAVDASPATGCKICPLSRDALTGWGRLDVTAAVLAALAGPLPPIDAREPNDDAGAGAPVIWGARGSLTATLDFWDDQIDVYRVRLRAGRRIDAVARGPGGTDTDLVLWKPGTRRVEDPRAQRFRAAQSATPGSIERLTYRAPKAGWYYLQVKLATPGAGPYTLSFTKR